MKKGKLVAAVYNEAEYASLRSYATAKGKSIYALVKAALKEYIERNP